MVATFNVGGAEKQLLELASNLDRSRFEVKVIAFRDGPLRAEFEERGVATEIVPKKWKIDPFLIPRLRRKIKQGNHDIVHTYMFTANTWGRISAMRWLAKGAPHLIAAERSIDNWKKPIHWMFDRALSKKSDYVIANANNVRRFLIEKGKLPSHKIRVIHNGVDSSKFAALVDRRDRPFSPVDLTILCVGRLDPVKGQDVLLDAVADISTGLPDARIILVGGAVYPPEKKFKSLLEEKLIRLGLTSRITMPGFHSDIRPFLRDADVMVLPSRREGFPNVIIEAMAAGVPVVATSVGGIPDIIDHEISGLVVPPDDKNALSDALRRSLTDQQLRTTLIAEGFLRANEFPIEKMVKQHEDLYEEMLSS